MAVAKCGTLWSWDSPLWCSGKKKEDGKLELMCYSCAWCKVKNRRSNDMTRAEQAALKAYPYEGGMKGLICENSRSIFIQGYGKAEKDIIFIIESRLSELLGDAQPTPILRYELQDLIKKIKDENNR